MKYTNYALVFPGQGAQRVGMCDAFLSSDIFVAHVQQASDYLGFDLLKLMQEGPAEQLTQTRYAQVALFVLETGLYRLFSQQKEFVLPLATAGHSLGEYSALCAAGALSFEQGIYLVQHRAAWMQADCEKQNGSMSAIIKPNIEGVSALCQQYSQVVIANDNSPEQMVLSGDADELKTLGAAIKSQKMGRALPLKVSGAFHSPLMQEASQKMQKLLESTTFSNPQFPIVMNSHPVAISEPKAIQQALIEQILAPVHWQDSMKHLEAMGAEACLELGPATLKRLILQNVPSMSFENLDTLESLKGLD